MSYTVVDKVADVLVQLREQALREQAGVAEAVFTCRELANRIHAARTGVHGLLVVLMDRGFVTRSRPQQQYGMGSPPYRYRLSPEWLASAQLSLSAAHKNNGVPMRGEDRSHTSDGGENRDETTVRGCARNADPNDAHDAQ